MIVVRFKVQSQPDKTDEVATALRDVVAMARGLPGAVPFDVARDPPDDNSFIATEVFEDRAAMDNEESQPEVAKVVALMETGAFTGPPEWTVYEVASSESPGG